MRILCRHGYLSFYPKFASDIARFTQYYGVTLERVEDYYTFPRLAECPKFSLDGLAYLDATATVNFEGNPWDVMRENGFVYDITNEEIVLKTSILVKAAPPLATYCFIAQSPLIQPGSRNTVGKQILSFDGEYNQENFQLRLSEFGYE